MSRGPVSVGRGRRAVSRGAVSRGHASRGYPHGGRHPRGPPSLGAPSRPRASRGGLGSPRSSSRASRLPRPGDWPAAPRGPRLSPNAFPLGSAVPGGTIPGGTVADGGAVSPRAARRARHRPRRGGWRVGELPRYQEPGSEPADERDKHHQHGGDDKSEEAATDPRQEASDEFLGVIEVGPVIRRAGRDARHQVAQRGQRDELVDRPALRADGGHHRTNDQQGADQEARVMTDDDRADQADQGDSEKDEDRSPLPPRAHPAQARRPE